MFRYCDRGARRVSAATSRRCALELLEERIALSGTPPAVVGLAVTSTEWAPAYISYLDSNGLGSGGYSIPVGSNAQTIALPWNNIDQIKIEFSKDVDIQAADMSLSGKNATTYAFADFFYDPQTRIASWTLASPISKDRLMIDLDANGIDPIVDLEGNVLDGEWTNNASTFASGNGSAGGDFEFLLNILPADANGSGSVTYADYVAIRSKEGKSTTSTGYNFKYDVDGSGQIETADWQFALGKVGTSLPSGSPAGVNNDAPTTKGFGPVSITNDAIDVAISLWDKFADAENGASGLVYSIASNSAPSLFDSVSINATSGELVVNAANGASGVAKVSVNATDSGGITTSSTATINVNHVNQPPIILYPLAEYQGAYTWLISGTVVDDEDVSDLIVEFYGVFETRAAVYPDGRFEFAIILVDEPYGWEFAVTHDLQGLESNTVSVVIGFS
jgi:hypothetical protein